MLKLITILTFFFGGEGGGWGGFHHNLCRHSFPGLSILGQIGPGIPTLCCITTIFQTSQIFHADIAFFHTVVHYKINSNKSSLLGLVKGTHG
jgi:hypothetical protein